MCHALPLKRRPQTHSECIVASPERKCPRPRGLLRRVAAGAEAFSIRRQEGSRWRLRRTRHLWRLVAVLVPAREAGLREERRSNWVAPQIWLGKWLRGQNRSSHSASFMGPEDTTAAAGELHVRAEG